ncbi:MAG: alpha/beta hydrolase [bacterium]|nr:alpha/beta hydrolase [bacterium]
MTSYKYNKAHIVGKSGEQIFFQCWHVDNPRAIMVISHGLGEHSGRYMNIINKLDGENISIFALDHRGHGDSSGKRGHVDSFNDYIYDLKTLIDMIKGTNEDLPMVLLGHSMGGLISFSYALSYPDDLNSLILSAPALVLAQTTSGFKESLIKMFSKIIPSTLAGNGLEAKDLSRDPEVIEAYENDPKVHNKISFRWYTEFMRAGAQCLARAYELRMPLLIFHGKSDNIISYKGSEEAYDKAVSSDKEIHLFKDYYHETMNEIDPEKEKVLNIIKDWLNRILGSPKKSAKKETAAKPAKKSPAKKKAASKKKAKKAAPKKKPVSKKTAKKVSKKAPKKVVKKTPKKVSKKAPKKVVKKTPKKVSKKVVKKAPKKASKKTSKKK